MRFPGTVLAYVLFPVWFLKLWLLRIRRARISRSSVDRWFDEVDPSLVVGGALFPGDLEKLRGVGVGAILNLCAEYLDDEAACAEVGVATLHVPVLDDTRPRRAPLEKALRWIDEQVASGKKVYVHCAAGRGRSVTVAASWLVLRRGLTSDDAVARIRAVRPAAGPTFWQRSAIRMVERELRAPLALEGRSTEA